MNTFWPSLFLSAKIALCATALTALFGIPLAFAMARLRFFGKSFLEAFLMAPLVLPPTVVGYLILFALGGRSPLGIWLKKTFDYSIIFSFEGAVLAAAVVAFPLLYMPAKAGFQNVDRELEDVSKLLGASRLQMFFHVSLPLASRGILSGLVLAFARAIGEFGATVMVFTWTSNRLTLPIAIYQAATEEDNLTAAAPAVIALSIITLALVLGYNRFTRVPK